MSRKQKRGTDGISPRRMESHCPIPIKVEAPDPDLISTLSDSSYIQTEQTTGVNTTVGSNNTLSPKSFCSRHPQEQDFLNNTEAIQPQTRLESIGLPAESGKQDNLVIRHKRARLPELRERGVPNGVFSKHAILSLDETRKGTLTRRTDDTGSILNVLSDSEKDGPQVEGVGEDLEETAVEEIDGDYDSTIKIEVPDVQITSEKSDEPDEISGSQSHPEMETLYPELVRSNEILDCIPRDSDRFSTTSKGLLPAITVKIELDEDPLSFVIPSVSASTSFINHEPTFSSNQRSQNRPYLKSYSRKNGQSISNSGHMNGTRNILPRIRFEDERKCLVCDASFLSGDALATHLYGHIPLENWQSKALGFGDLTSNLNDVIGENNLSSSIPQDLDPDEDVEEISGSLPVDPLCLAGIKTEVSEMDIEIHNRTDTVTTFNDGSASLDRRTAFEKRYPSLSKRPLLPKSTSNKSRISKKMKTVEAPNMNCTVSSASQIKEPKITPPRRKNVNLKSEVKTPVQKSQAKMFKPQRRDGSNCPFGFGDVVQKLVEKGKILIK